ncbi:hypothetical protein F5887DRAFT_476211 [Amanita rubescens]|nr:hypothetical protein F5887DRAFT_476211 [Amanita rubescens]
MWQTIAPELVIEIYKHFLSGLTLSVTEPAFFPWYLGHICSRWRNTFISSPYFFNSLTIDLEEKGKGIYQRRSTRFKRTLAIVRFCMQSTNDHPISLRLTLGWPELCYNLKRTSKSRFCRLILQSLIGESVRWRDAYITLHVSELPILYAAKDQLQMLRSIKLELVNCSHICAWDLSMARPPRSFADLFVDAPQLTRVYIGDYLDWEIDWSTISVIHLKQPPSPDALLELLRQVDCLEELAIYESSDIRTPYKCGPLIALPFLRVLRISDADLLPLLKTHMLDELSVRNDVRSLDSRTFNGVVSSFLPTLHRLRKLAFFANDAHDAEVLFQHMPDIQDLSLYLDEASCLNQLATCPRVHQLKTLTLGLPCTVSNMTTLTACMNRKPGPSVIDSFAELGHFSLELYRGVDTRFCTPVAERLERSFKELGVPCAIHSVNGIATPDVKFASFDVF